MVMTGESVVDFSPSTSTPTIPVPTSPNNLNSYTRCSYNCLMIQMTLWVSLNGILVIFWRLAGTTDLSTFNRMFGGLSLTMAYGIPIREHDDPYLALAKEAIHTIAAAVVPGAFLVDF